jgi:hypothetical protein
MTVRRKVSVTTLMNLTDHETFGANEHASAQLTRVAVVTDDVDQQLMYMEARCGGEIRVELTLNAIVLQNGDIRIEGNAKLYEGASDRTNELNGENDFTVLIPANKFVPYFVNVWNTYEGERDDKADITMHFRNSQIA